MLVFLRNDHQPVRKYNTLYHCMQTELFSEIFLKHSICFYFFFFQSREFKDKQEKAVLFLRNFIKKSKFKNRL